ncbi:putative sensor histidine kinase TcrY [Rhodobacteraceae bacterium THAF1]|uniref:sensor histidine kinase n=1 Tax=Palleronia sp. THAF1 TaxID=2587842 RepID=UPI000F41EA2F|nr:ATP-binding protein [Palleronia sp. THAF1]QFU09660.1 putative sensor histidine kinase TcrY [Palleronia sp. THAF1]VDC17437.1 putative sensor histidine kinase TcrY [Rhodobacteraceae bacterium THAF1]
MLEQIARKTAARCAERGIVFAHDLPAQPVQLAGDPVMFEQAILNLLDNALVHGGPDTRKIDLTARTVDGALHIMVRDDGKGIPPDAFDRTLERFSQIGAGTGSGLGLPIAAAVAESFGGRIALANEAGQLSVTLILPM